MGFGHRPTEDGGGGCGRGRFAARRLLGIFFCSHDFKNKMSKRFPAMPVHLERGNLAKKPEYATKIFKNFRLARLGPDKLEAI
jgi:hypothetical protein